MPFIDNPQNFNCQRNFIFRDRDIIVMQDGSLPSDQIMNRCLELFSGTDWFIDSPTNSAVLELNSDEPDPTGCKSMPLRQFFFDNSEEVGTLAAREKGYINWRKSTRYCSSCGAKLVNNPAENSRICKKCGKIHFPRIEPCIIVLISKGDEILLARHKLRNQTMYTCIAGFIELGETIEAAVEREILEEVGLKVKNVQYKGSQGWPFPDQLMLAFTAEYESGEIKLQEDELTEAKWFNRTQIPVENIPAPGSVAYKLINGIF